MFELVLEKAEEPEIKLPTSAGSLKKQESSRKTSIYRVRNNWNDLAAAAAHIYTGFPVGSALKESARNAETWVQSLGGEDPLEKGKAAHSSIVAWRIPYSPWGRKESDTNQRLFHFHIYTHIYRHTHTKLNHFAVHHVRILLCFLRAGGRSIGLSIRMAGEHALIGQRGDDA